MAARDFPSPLQRGGARTIWQCFGPRTVPPPASPSLLHSIRFRYSDWEAHKPTIRPPYVRLPNGNLHLQVLLSSSTHTNFTSSFEHCRAAFTEDSSDCLSTRRWHLDTRTMDTLQLKPRRPVEEEVENWDDGDFMVDGDDLTLRSASTTTAPSRRRDSNSSHLSIRSELESWAGEEEKQVHLPGDDEKSTLDAISAAQNAGIPLPKGIPTSALMGGTIKRLGGRKIRKITHEDWDSDLDFPDITQGLKMKPKEQTDFPETLRQVSGGSVQTSPIKATKSPALQLQDDRREPGRSSFGTQITPMDLDKFKDNDDDDFFGDGCATIKVSKRPASKPISLITPPTPQKKHQEKQQDDDFEQGLELPSHGTLQLSSRRDIPKTPSSQADDLDWGEGSSLGTRWGGTKRDGRSNRSSSASALSPSVSSSITAESEDETFDGLLLPSGPVNFQERLQLKRKSKSPERPVESSPPKKPSAAEADQPGFLDGLDIGNGDVFNSGKLTLHRNIKVKDSQPSSPARPKTAVSLTFTNKPAVSTRIPRLSHERAHSTSLEPVSESGGPIPQRARRPQSRLGHSAQSSVTSIPTPTTPSSSSPWSPGTPNNRKELGAKTSTPSLRNEPTTTNSQLLKQKRSLPAIRALNPPTRPLSSRFERPPSRGEGGRPQSGVRPKTPVERQRSAGIESPGQTRRGHLPFIPAGASSSQSHHVSSRSGRQFRRHDSDNSIDLRPTSRTYSRSGMRSPSPQRYRVAADTWERLSKPKGKKNFGDGHELDAFDDLPTSKEAETKYMKQPSSNNSKPVLRHKATNSGSDRTSTPTPVSQPMKTSSTPRFARDTAASRIARETSLAHRSTSSTGGPLAQTHAQRGTPLAPRGHVNTQHLQPPPRAKKSKRPPQLKPHLISNLNSGKESKMVNGMFYNAETFQWEGNENALNIFDGPTSTPTSTNAPPIPQERQTPTPRPALITNFSATKGVQVVNGMVFDPETMCWLKIGNKQSGKSEATDPMEKFNALEDDDDPFKDIPDLEDSTEHEEGHGRVSDINDDWLVGEEFDVGPEFVRRQREEEVRWRKKCEQWVGRGHRDHEAWRWTIRELVSQFNELPV